MYSLGVIMFVMLTGHLPYTSTTPLGLITKHMTEPIPSLRKVAPDAKLSSTVDGIVRKALAKDREHRWQSAAELAAALEKAQGTTTIVVPALTAEGPQSRMWIAGAVGGVALVALGLLLFNAMGAKETETEDAPVVEEPIQPAAPPAANTVKVRLTGAPADARVYVGDRDLGPASDAITLDKSEASVPLEIVAPGFERSTVHVVPLADLAVPVSLVAKPPEPEPEPVEPEPVEPEPVEPEPVAKSIKKKTKKAETTGDNPDVNKEIGF